MTQNYAFGDVVNTDNRHKCESITKVGRIFFEQKNKKIEQ